MGKIDPDVTIIDEVVGYTIAAIGLAAQVLGARRLSYVLAM